MEKEEYVNFNGRVRVRLVLRAEMLAAQDEEIALRKRLIYQVMGVDAVPCLTLDESLLLDTTGPANAPLADLAHYVHFAPHLQHSTAAGGGLRKRKTVADDALLYLFDALVGARDNGIFNYFLEEAAPRDARGDEMMSHELYIETGYWNRQEVINTTKTRLKRAVALWEAVAEAGEAKLWEVVQYMVAGRASSSLAIRMSRTTEHYSKLAFHLELAATRWARFVEHTLREAPGSQLAEYEVGASRSRFAVVAVDPDDESQYAWHDLVADYWARNPVPQSSKEVTEAMAAAGSLYSRPHDYDVLNRETISFVALDREYGGASGAGPAQRIAGYVSCSLKTIHAVAGAQRFKSDELNRFVASLAARARDRAERDCGYDVFSIDGLHVGAVAEGERPYRAGTGLAKLLVFYAMEFVRLAARQLGVALVISGAEAVQTKAILTGGFGFTHYNRENALRWLRMAFEDYYTAKLEPERGEGGGGGGKKRYAWHGTVEKLLTPAYLVAQLEEYRAQYLVDPPDQAARDRNTLRGIAQGVADMAAQYRQLAEAPNGADLMRRAVKGTVSRLYEYWVAMQEMIEKRAAARKEGTLSEVGYLERVREFLGTGCDTQDTFLFIGERDERFSRLMAEFGEALRADRLPAGGLLVEERRVPRREQPAVVVIISSSDEEDGRVATQLSQTCVGGGADVEMVDALFEPTEEEMALYEAWVGGGGGEEVLPALSDRNNNNNRPPPTPVGLTEAERERERAALAGEIAALEAEREVRARALAATETLLRERRARFERL